MKNIFILTVLFVLSNLIFAQENPKKCLTTSIVEKELENNREYKIMGQKLMNYQKDNKDNNEKNQTEIIIPVVIHIVHRIQDNIGSNTNISNAQIEDQLRILNEDYSKTNPEFPNPAAVGGRNTFLSSAGNPEIKFCLATTDPNGNSTTGITRKPTSKSSWDYDTESNDMKQASSDGVDNWDPLRYMNIWVCNLSGGGVLGYAYLPGLQNSNESWKDGLVVDYKYFGTIGNASSSSDGRTPTHEIGHYLGLRHTFCESNSGGCCDNDNSSWGLSVDDTPATDGIYWGNVNSSTNNNTCNDLNYGFSNDLYDMDENYMSYSSTTWMFSNGQVSLIRDVLSAPAWQGGRSSLTNSTVSVNCSGIIPVPGETWECDGQGNCYDPGNGNGQYSSLTICNAACNSTSVEDTKKYLLLYPNPTNGNLFINTSEKIISISVFNIIGKEVIANAENNNSVLNLSQLSNGVYFISISTEKGVLTSKIVISK
jgi:hypothetical protein